MSLADLLKKPVKEIETDSNDLVGRLFRKAINTREGVRITSDAFRPSQLHWTCAKQFFFNYYDPCLFDKQTPENYLATGIGTEIHSVIQNEILGPMGILTGEWEINNAGIFERYSGTYRNDQPRATYIEPVYRDEKYRLAGKVDGFISLDRLQHLEKIQRKIKTEEELISALAAIPFGEPTLCDIKTTKAEYFEEHKRQIPQSYQIQANLYMYLVGVSKMVFFYINKNDGSTFTKEYHKDPAVLSLALKKITVINNAIVDKKLPEVFNACTSPEDYRAKKCPFKDICFDPLFNLDAWIADREFVNAKKGISLPVFNRI